MKYLKVLYIRRKNPLLKIIIISTILIMLVIATLIIFCAIKNINNHKNTLMREYYAVYTPVNLDSEKSVQSQVQNLRVRGGAGVLLNSDNQQRIILAIFPDKTKAEAVASQQDEGLSAGIMSIHTADYTECATNENYSHLVNKYFEVIDTLYSLCDSLDKNEISQTNAGVKIQMLSLQWTNLASHEMPDDIQNLALCTASLLTYLANNDSYTTNLVSYTSEIRHILVQLVLLKNA